MSKPYFKIEQELFDFEPVKLFLESHSNLDIQGLSKIDSKTIRIWYYKINEENGTRYLTSELIEF